MTNYADGTEVYRNGYFRGLRPEPELWVDEWADRYMRIPQSQGGAEPGPYRTARTPYAREPMQCLSPAHPCKRVVTMIASQLMKTQIALNWIGGCIHMAPANILLLEPTQRLAHDIAARFDQAAEVVPELRERIVKPRSREGTNTSGVKQFEGGRLFIATAGSSSNLAEKSVRYVYGDEIDRWEMDLNSEGDPVKLAEARASTFGRNAKFYFSSTPTLKGASRIDDLFRISDQRHFYVPCPHCQHMQVLDWSHLKWDEAYAQVQYLCNGPDCGALIDEHEKATMLAKGEWRAHSHGDGETIGFQLNALYAPLGWTSWILLAREFDSAMSEQKKGNQSLMQVFYNTRLGLPWDSALEQTKADELQARALQETYVLGTVPTAALMLTAAVDVQGNRLEFMVMGWGAGLERWVIDHQVIMGDPSDDRTWETLDNKLKARYRHPSGVGLSILATAIDSGGNHTHEVYQFCRIRRWRNVFAVKGESRRGKPIIAQRPSRVDVNWRGNIEKNGAELWMIGTDTAKDWIYNRYALVSGPGALHFAKDLPDDFFAQCVAERKVARFVKGEWRVEWTKGKADRNEALDLMVYARAMAEYLGLGRYHERDWDRVRQSLMQHHLFEDKSVPADPIAPRPSTEKTEVLPVAKAVSVPPVIASAPPVTAHHKPMAVPPRRISTSGYLKRR